MCLRMQVRCNPRTTRMRELEHVSTRDIINVVFAVSYDGVFCVSGESELALMSRCTIKLSRVVRVRSEISLSFASRPASCFTPNSSKPLRAAERHLVASCRSLPTRFTPTIVCKIPQARVCGWLVGWLQRERVVAVKYKTVSYSYLPLIVVVVFAGGGLGRGAVLLRQRLLGLLRLH